MTAAANTGSEKHYGHKFDRSRNQIMKYQPPEMHIDSCGECWFFAGCHGYFCDHPETNKNRGKGNVPKIPSVTVYHHIPDWCPLEELINPNKCDGKYESCQKCKKKYDCEWSRV